MKQILMVVLGMLMCAFPITAQVTSQPSPLMEDSQDVVIFFHADQGNKGLMGLTSSAQIYAHTGVLTNESKSDSDWKFAPEWGDNSPKYKLEYVSSNLWKLNIGDIRSYYGITNPAIIVKKLAFVFRTADKSKEGKGTNDTDIFLNVYQEGTHVELTSSLSSPFAVAGESVTLSAISTTAGRLEILKDGVSVKSADSTTTLDYTFTPQTGESGWKFVAKITTPDGENVESEPLTLVLLTPSAQGTYPGGVPTPGAYWSDATAGVVTFCLPAPGKSSVSVVGSWDNFSLPTTPMKYQDYNGQRYFWQTISGLNVNENVVYYYYVDGTYQVGDPYARLVLDPWNDKYIPESVYPNLPVYPYNYVNNVTLAVLEPASKSYNWKVTDFKGAEPSNLRIYELLIRDFTGTEGQAYGTGTVRGAMEMIPYIRNLGFNAIELLPINEFNGNISWGYNPNFYFAPDKAYGTPDDYKEFIDKCHEAGIAVILDMVFNQTDWQHPWYQMYEVGSNPMYNATAPHAYSVLNDWNQGHPLVQKQWDDVLTFWLQEYKVDGFRFDLVKGLGDNSSYSNSGDAATNAYNQSRIDRMKRLQGVVNQVHPGAYFINENLAGAREENAMAATGQLNWANINDPGCQYAMGYSSGSGLGVMYAPYNDNRTWGSTVSYLESHDEQRLAYKQNQYGASGVKGNLGASMQRLGSCAAQMIMAPGAHMTWMFSEMGNDQNNKTSTGGNNTDPKIVCWNLLQQPEREGLAKTYSRLNRIREKFPELFASNAFFESKCNASDWGSGRTMISRAGNRELYTVLNPNISGTLDVKVNFSNKNNSSYAILTQSYGADCSFDAVAGTVKVPANCFVVIGSAEMAGVDETFAEGISQTDSHIYIIEGGVAIESNSRADIYRIDGTLAGVAEGKGRREVFLTPGIYIVRTSGFAQKVRVK